MQAETIAKEIAVITIHGMGREDKEYYKGFEERLQRKLGVKWERVAFGHIYYQDTLEPNEQFVYDQMQKAKTPFRSFIVWRLLREFLLFYFADPGSLENNKTARESAYYQTQAKIANELRRIYVELGRNKKAKVVIAAHSLGCQVISSYVWDAQYASEQFEAIRKMTRVGFWGKIGELQTDDPDELDFLKLTSLHRLYTCGCNIPLFTAGHDYIVPFKSPNPDFKWQNYYSRNDVLGYPMEPLRGRKGLKDPYYEDHPTYAELVEDHEIRAGNLLQFWNPLAHTGYLTDDNFIDPIVRDVESLLT
jgi:hypothetical protein